MISDHDEADHTEVGRTGIVLCATCGVEYAAGALPALCPICADERQWVPADGQQWLDAKDLAALPVRTELVEREPDLFGISIMGGPGLNQQAKLIRTEHGNVMVDVPAWIDDDLANQVADLGPLVAIVPSHPHMYGLQSRWSERFGAPVWLARQDLEWLGVRPREVREFDSTEQIVPGVTVGVAGGHFPGSIVVHWQAPDGAGVMLTGDTIGVNRDRATVTFLRSFPNRLPLSGPDAIRIARFMGTWDYDRVYDNFGGVLTENGAAAVAHSAERHSRWSTGLHDDRADPEPSDHGKLRGGTVMRQVRTVRDVENSVRFWTEGVGFELLWHSDPGTSAMAAVGLPGAGWHLELVAGEAGSVPSDPLVLYLGAPPSPDWVRTIEVHGGLTVPLHGYWAEDIGFMDPEGYLLILSSRSWTGSHLVGEHQQQAEDTQQQDRGAEE